MAGVPFAAGNLGLVMVLESFLECRFSNVIWSPEAKTFQW